MMEHRNKQSSPTTKEELLQALLNKRLQAAKEQSLRAASEVSRTDRTSPQPLSPGQRRLWFLNHWLPENAAYNIPLAVRVKGPIGVDALEKSIARLVERHDILRARFEMREGVPWQITDTEYAFRLNLLDLSHMSLQEEELQRRINEESAQPFDLATGPLFYAALWVLGDGEHLLFMNMHHIVSDGWSMGLIFREIATGYNALCQGEELRAEKPVQYADFTHWQSQQQEQERIHKQMAYWKEQLADMPKLLELPYDRPRPLTQTYSGANIPLWLPELLVDKLRGLARKEETTLYNVLLAAFHIMLRRYSGQSDIVVGIPVANRRHKAFEEVIGFFVNTIAVRAQVDENAPFLGFLQTIKQLALEAYSNQEVPFEQLVNELAIERNVNYSPIFQVMLAYNNAPAVHARLDQLSLEVLPIETGTSKLDLTLELWDTEQGLQGRLEFNSSLFHAETAIRMRAHYIRLLESIADAPLKLLYELDMFSTDEHKQLLYGWNSGEHRAESDPFTAPIYLRFERQAEIQPDAVAVQYGAVQMTYAELNRRANQLAHRLRQQGVGANQLVGLCMDRSTEMIAGMLGILKAGGAYVPLDPDAPAERLAFIMADSQMEWLVTQEHLLPIKAASGCTVVCIDQLPEDEETEGNPVPNVSGEDLAYVIYTSGSTGKPKGVLSEHRNVTRLFSSTEHWYGFDSTDVWALFHSYAFDFSVWEIWGALAYGGKLVIVPYWTSRSAEDLYNLLLEEQITVLNQTPSAFQQLLREDERRNDVSGSGMALRYIIFGGEALEPAGLRPWIDKHGDAKPQLINMYGITETTVHSTFRRITKHDTESGDGSVIGVPIPDLNMYLLDEYMRPVAIGVTGEIYISGIGVARGYLNRPELTAQRFLPCPFDQAETLYKSGDLARRLSNDEVVFVGRSDDQVKIRGYRIELGEIEEALNQYPRIKQAVVLVKGGEGNAKRLVAFLMVDEHEPPTAAEIRDALFRKLPDYMIPSVFEVLPEMPLTANGKINRQALLDSIVSPLQAHGAYIEPADETEKKLAAIWREVLQVQRVGAEDNFFVLGGDSILALQAVTLMKEQGYPITLQKLFHMQTIRALSSSMEGLEADSHDTMFSVLEPFARLSGKDRGAMPADAADAYPLTGLQAGMLFHMDRNEDSTSYLNMTSLKIQMVYDREKLQRAVDHIVSQHAVLRTSFDFVSYTEPLQIVHQQAVLEVLEENISHLNDEAQEEYIEQWVKEEVARKFNLLKPPLLRISVHIRSPQMIQFSLTECHAILDGWSFTSIIRDIFMEYYRLLEGKPLSQPEAQPFHFRDFVWMERECIRSEAHQLYWKEQLQAFPLTRIPRWTLAEYTGQRQFQRSLRPIPNEIERGIRALAQECKVPIKSVLLTAHLKLLQILAGQSDVMTGLVSNGRPEVDGGDRIRGLFLNTLPFRLQLAEGSWRELVQAVFAHEREMMEYRHFPLSEIQKNLGRNKGFETAFNFVHFHAIRDLVAGTSMEILDLKEVADTNFVLQAAFSMIPTTGELILMLDTNGAEVTQEQSDIYALYYVRILKEMTDHCEQPHQTYSLLRNEERQQLMTGLNGTVQHYPLDRCLHQWIEDQVERTPDQAAIVFRTEQLSYRELNERANQLARYLLRQGVEADQIVGVCMQRSLEMTVCLLAILKAGCAYVPIDPDLPARRIRDMLEDAQIAVVLTESSLMDIVDFGGLAVELDLLREALVQEPTANLPSQATPDSLAYIIYTSGSTGKPKGVKLHHRGVCNRLIWMQEQYQLNHSDRVLQKTPYTFDVSVWEFFWPLMCGAALVVAVPEGHKNTPYLVELIQTEEITTIHFVPSMLDVFLDHSHASQCRTLRRVICSGEALSIELQQKFFETMHAELHNLYGPTEASIDVTHWQCLPGVKQTSVPIGRPIANTSIYILDGNAQPVPLGVPGELYIGGIGVGAGYTDEELTRQRFLDDPFLGQGKMFRTGDAARWMPDGTIVYIGRLDDQLKIAGNRIEPGDIESVLRRHKNVKEAVVTAKADRTGNLQLYAYVILRRAVEDADQFALQMFAKRNLPEYMRPAEIIFVDHFPLTVNGKVNKRALPEPSAPAARLKHYVPPQTEEEVALAELWEDILQIEQVGLLDNFLELGGHSLLLIRLAQRIEEQFAVQTDLALLLEADHLEAMAQLITDKRSKIASS